MDNCFSISCSNYMSWKFSLQSEKPLTNQINWFCGTSYLSNSLSNSKHDEGISMMVSTMLGVSMILPLSQRWFHYYIISLWFLWALVKSSGGLINTVTLAPSCPPIEAPCLCKKWISISKSMEWPWSIRYLIFLSKYI